MLTKNLLKVLLVPASVLALSATASADVNCADLTVQCKTFTKGGAKFKPILTPGLVGTCPSSVPANLEAISIKGTISDCTVSDPSVKIISGSVKGTLYTNDCSCTSLAVPFNTLTTPPAGKLNSLAVSWKFAAGSACLDGKSSTLVMTPGVSGIAAGTYCVPEWPFGCYGKFSLAPPGVAVSGLFRGGDLGADSVTTGLTTEDATGLLSTCLTSGKGLKGITFGIASAAFSPSGAFLE